MYKLNFVLLGKVEAYDEKLQAKFKLSFSSLITLTLNDELI